MRHSRRQLLVLGSALLAACKRADPEPKTCPPAQLSAEDAKTREMLKYTEHCLDAQKVCSSCQQYLPKDDTACGTCKILNGPIHPNGSCTAFSAKS